MEYIRVPVHEVEDPPPTHPTANWRPWALRTSTLISFILLCVCLLIGNEITIRGCATGGCHVFGKSSGGSVSPASDFVYTQFPTALGVALSLLWILPHHDICRLEPYFRMSAEGGEKARESLFLDYPYQIAVFIPVRALYKKHYVVTLSSTILLLMNFLIVPLVPTIFTKLTVMAPFPGNATRALFDVSRRNVSADFTFLAYEYAWRGGTLAPFMTDTYALLPVQPEGHVFDTVEDWTVETTLFEAALQCTDARPPEVGYFNNMLTINITSMDRGFRVPICDAGALEQDRLTNITNCPVSTAFITPWTSISWQIGNTAEPPVSYMYAWASGPSSPPNISDNFTFPRPINITAVFCTPSYYSEPVNATISMPSGKVLNVTRSGRSTKIDTLRGFDGILDGNVENNCTGEGLVLDVRLELPVRFGYPPQTIASVALDLIHKFGESSRPISTYQLGRASRSTVFMTRTNSLASFSLHNQSNATLGELLDARTLASTNDRGLKLLFAFAVAEMASNYTGTTHVPVVRKVPTVSITVNSDWALAVSTGLSVIILLAAVLVFLIRRRPCELDGEPNSMAASLRLLSASPALCATMRYAEYYKTKMLSISMEANDLFFKLDLDKVDGPGPTIRVIRGTQGTAVEFPYPKLMSDPGDTPPIETKKPWTMTTLIGSVGCFPMVAVLLIIAVLLIASFSYSQANDGFPISGDPNSFRSKVLYTYLPLTVSTAIELMLITIGANQCMIAPYKALETKKARYSKSLAVDYDKCPPHFQLYSSLINGEYSLAALSMAILLSIALAVASAGLFPASPQVATRPRPHNIIRAFPNARQEIYFQLSQNLTRGYSQTWTTADFYVDPPYEVAPTGEGEYNTIGFGMNITCTLVPDSRITFPCSTQYNFSESTCADLMQDPYENILTILEPCGAGTADTPLPVRWDGSCMDGIAPSKSCESQIIPVWAQNLKFNVTPPGSPPDTIDDYRFVVLNCSFADRIVDLTAKVKDGQVLSLTNVRPLDTTRLASVYPANKSSAANFLTHSFADVLRQSIEAEAPSFQNLLIARINYLMATLDPSVVPEPHNMTHVPNMPVAARAFEDILQHLFVLLVRISADDIFSYGVTPGLGYVNAYRVHVHPMSFGISLGIVLFSCGVIVAVYWGQDPKVVGHLPWSLAEMYSHLYASNVTEDMRSAGTLSLEKIKEQNERLGRTYAYGHYPEGRHYGVYRVGGEGLVAAQNTGEISLEMNDL